MQIVCYEVYWMGLGYFIVTSPRVMLPDKLIVLSLYNQIINIEKAGAQEKIIINNHHSCHVNTYNLQIT